ncbi:hypothetical protein CROQUDRAFT_657985 [Cronartium quercuum f. sp. fusiforme G11]|uniref:Uncharacterized protein n=1 Tax=Cronartium quercuum f. sp. fusiforme G11 TaxID=708437 RepID=A0A9P6NL51_9BASI|nr:hypothetical protein CROQUDRAFT_657985 [Cronartium quercuum f. sp. fusiforme G11]
MGLNVLGRCIGRVTDSSSSSDYQYLQDPSFKVEKKKRNWLRKRSVTPLEEDYDIVDDFAESKLKHSIGSQPSLDSIETVRGHPKYPESKIEVDDRSTLRGVVLNKDSERNDTGDANHDSESEECRWNDFRSSASGPKLLRDSPSSSDSLRLQMHSRSTFCNQLTKVLAKNVHRRKTLLFGSRVEMLNSQIDGEGGSEWISPDPQLETDSIIHLESPLWIIENLGRSMNLRSQVDLSATAHSSTADDSPTPGPSRYMAE